MTNCRFKFPKFPIWKTLISKPTHITGEEKQEMMKKHNLILKNVKEVLENEDNINAIMKDYDKETENRHEFEVNREKRIRKDFIFYQKNLH